MKQVIKTNSGDYIFNVKEFKWGTKIINKEISKENLLLFKKILDNNEVKFILAYGTLLGAIRENGFISHDEDTDVIILDEDRQRFIDILFELRQHGFEVGRYEDDLLSIIKNGEYIDIYIFKHSKLGYRTMCGEMIKEHYLINTIKYELFDVEFDIPEKYIGYLEYYYGKNWRTPIKGEHGSKLTPYSKIKQIVNEKCPSVFKVLKALFKKSK